MAFTLKDIAARWFVRPLSIDKALLAPNAPDLKQAVRLKKELRDINKMADGDLALKFRATQLALKKTTGEEQDRLQAGLKYLRRVIEGRKSSLYLERAKEINRQRNQDREAEQQDRLERYKYTRAWRGDI